MKNNSTTLMDHNVTLIMITCIVVGIIVIAFRYKNYEPCIPVKITVRDGKINTGELVRFTAETQGITTKELVWDFGDKSIQRGNENIVTHIFTTPAKYDIALTINGTCREYKTIYVTKAPSPLIKLSSPTFTCQSTAQVGEMIIFTDSTPNATSWNWRFGETNTVDATTPIASYTYSTPGLKDVSLVVNGSMEGYSTIDVKMPPPKEHIKPKTSSALLHRAGSILRAEQLNQKNEKEVSEIQDTPKSIQTKPVETPKAPVVSKSQMEAMLRQVVDGHKDVSIFLVYFCGNLDFKVNYNNRLIPFSQMCGELKGEMKKSKKIKALEVFFERDPNTNCIKYMKIDAKKKWL
jgi:PKD repeat protein